MCKSKREGGLGFRDLENFNQTLLAKQAWRLLPEPNTLIAKVYNSRYFLENEFMMAGAGRRPSYAWRSILHGRELLEKGLLRVIGDGKNTFVWIDKWIMDSSPRRPYNKQRSMDLNLRVESLISAQGTWKIEALAELFLQEDIDRILSFPPAIAREDSLIWAHTKEGGYTVKSGNWLISSLGVLTNSQRNPNQVLNELKTKSWKIETEPKIRLFLWRVLSGALAVAERIVPHGMQTKVVCAICHGDVESIKHVLFECVVARQVWSNINIPVALWNSGSIEEYMDKLYECMNTVSVAENHRRVIPWLLWGIWKERNSHLYAGRLGDSHITTVLALEEADIWFKLKEETDLAHSQSMLVAKTPVKWKKPNQGFLKCNIHASWINSHMMCGGAWIIRDNNGDVQFHAREAFLAASNRIAAEFRCALWTLRSLKDIHIENVEFWSDCGAMIEALKNPRDWPRYRSYIDRFNRLRMGFHNCKVELSSPQANTVARRIATSVTREGRLHSYLAAGGPSWLS